MAPKEKVLCDCDLCQGLDKWVAPKTLRKHKKAQADRAEQARDAELAQQRAQSDAIYGATQTLGPFQPLDVDFSGKRKNDEPHENSARSPWVSFGGGSPSRSENAAEVCNLFIYFADGMLTKAFSGRVFVLEPQSPPLPMPHWSHRAIGRNHRQGRIGPRVTTAQRYMPPGLSLLNLN